MIKFIAKTAVTLALTLSVSMAANAANVHYLLEASVNGNQGIVFTSIQGKQEAETEPEDTKSSEPVVKIASEMVPVETYGPLQKTNTSCDTLFLMDVSTSINSRNQKYIDEFMNEYVQGKKDNRKYALMTLGESADLVQDFTSDRYEFMQTVKQIKFDQKASGFYTAADAALTVCAEQMKTGSYVQLIIITDGVELDDQGITREELMEKLAENPVPIHTLGCKRNDGNQEALKQLYALSRESNGISGQLNNESMTELANQIHDFEENILQIVFTIPEEFKDGSKKTIGIYMDGTSQADILYDIRMPMKELPEQTVTSAQESPAIIESSLRGTTPKKKSITGNMIAYLVIISVVLLGAIALIFILKKNKKKNTINQTASNQKKEIIMNPGPSNQGSKVLLIGQNNLLETKEIMMNGEILIGRQPNCQVIIEDLAVSGRHCKIYGSNLDFYIEDLASTNHTYVNGVIVQGPVRLHSGDMLKFGRIEYEIRF